MFNLFKKEKIVNDNINSEYKFACYSFSSAQLSDLRDLIKILDLEYESIIAQGKEYLSHFDHVLERQLFLQNGLGISFKDGTNLNVVYNRHKGETLYGFTFFFINDLEKIDIFFNYVSKSNGIYYAYLANQTDIEWQNQTSMQFYQANNRSMKNIRFCKDIFDMKSIDVSRNFGRTFFEDGILYVAAYIIWFGDIQKIFGNADFSFAYSVENLPNGLLKVQLVSDLNVDLNSCRPLQKKFLQQLNLL